MFKERFTTRTYETDFNNRLRLSSVLNYLQEVAANDADQLGFGFREFTGKGIFWVLSRIKIQMDSYPVIGEPLIVETWPKSLRPPFAIRDFQLFDEEGQVTGRATSAWLIVDRNTLRPLRPEGIMKNIQREEDRHAIEEMPGKLFPAKELNIVNEVKVAYTDIDVNQHVNNVKYLEYVLDGYSEQDLRNTMISELQINFINECRFGEKISILKGQHQGNDYFEGIKENGIKVFQAALTFILYTESLRKCAVIFA